LIKLSGENIKVLLAAILIDTKTIKKDIDNITIMSLADISMGKYGMKYIS
jgi:hypothetical protein